MIRPLVSLSILLLLSITPVVEAQQPPPAHQHETAQSPPTQDDHAAHQSPAAPLPAFIPPVTDADRAAAFPDVHGHPAHDTSVNYFVLFDQLEWQTGRGSDAFSWDTKGWVGRDRNRFWFRSEGDRAGGLTEQAQTNLLYGRAVARWWDVTAGVRVDTSNTVYDGQRRILSYDAVIHSPEGTGTSTVSELAVIGRPSILVPFPHAIDQDQAANARHLAETGAALVVPQTQFTPQFLADALVSALSDPQSLTKRAEAARSAGVADAADRLADLVLEVAARKRGTGDKA